MDIKSPAHSICLFCAYFAENSIPEYIRVYLKELKRHYPVVWLLTNRKQLDNESEAFLEQNHIELRLYRNEGFDFGMWSKALDEISAMKYNEIALVNDSCILFRKLDRVMDVIHASDWDYAGLVSSRQVSWHIQSYFIVMREPVIATVRDYFSQHGHKNEFERVILDYEVGLSDWLLKKGFKLGTVFSIPGPANLNPSFMEIGTLIRQGFPLVKKKLINGAYRPEEVRGLLIRNFIFNPDYYVRLIHQHVPELLFDPAKMKSTHFKLQLMSFAATLMAFPFSLMRAVKFLVKR